MGAGLILDPGHNLVQCLSVPTEQDISELSAAELTSASRFLPTGCTWSDFDVNLVTAGSFQILGDECTLAMRLVDGGWRYSLTDGATETGTVDDDIEYRNLLGMAVMEDA